MKYNELLTNIERIAADTKLDLVNTDVIPPVIYELIRMAFAEEKLVFSVKEHETSVALAAAEDTSHRMYTSNLLSSLRKKFGSFKYASKEAVIEAVCELYKPKPKIDIRYASVSSNKGLCVLCHINEPGRNVKFIFVDEKLNSVELI